MKRILIILFLIPLVAFGQAKTGIRNGYLQNDLDANNKKILNLDTSNLSLLPTQTGHNGQYLQTNGTIASWVTVNTVVNWTDIVGKPSTFPPSTHTHPQSDVTNLVTDLSAIMGDITQISADLETLQPLLTLGTGVQTALGVNTGTDGAFVVKGGALGEPTSGNINSGLIAAGAVTLAKMADITGPVILGRTTADATGAPKALTLGTGVLTALSAAPNASGGVVLYNGALGTPTSGTGTNITGIPESGVTNLTTDLAAKAPLASPVFTGHPTIEGVTSTGAIGTGKLVFNSALISTAGATWDGGGSVLTTGKAKGYWTCPYSGTITGWDISVDTGTATFTVWKIATGTAVPTISNVINTSGVAISTGTSVHSTTVSDFTSTTVTAGDIFAFVLKTVASATEATFTVEITK